MGGFVMTAGSGDFGHFGHESLNKTFYSSPSSSFSIKGDTPPHDQAPKMTNTPSRDDCPNQPRSRECESRQALPPGPPADMPPPPAGRPGCTVEQVFSRGRWRWQVRPTSSLDLAFWAMCQREGLTHPGEYEVRS